MSWHNVWRRLRRAEPVRRLIRDERAQAMTEAAIVMPIVVLVFVGAHEFMYMNEWKYLTGRASRCVVWSTAEHDNYPEYDYDDPANTSDVSKARGTELYNASAEDMYVMLFKDKLGVEGYGVTPTKSTDDYAFKHTFNFTTDIAEGGGSESEVTDDINSGSPDSGGFGSVFGDVLNVFGQFAGEAVTGMSVPGVGFLRFGPELPVRGQVEGGFTVAWKPLFHAIITSADGTSGGGSGDSTHAFYGSEEAQERYETEVLQTYNGMDEVVPIGMIGDGETTADLGRTYGRFALLTHDWRHIDTDPDPEKADVGTFHWHVKGWTLLGALSGSYGVDDPGDGGDLFGDVVQFLDEAFFPFKCCLRVDRIGHPDEHEKHTTENYPVFGGGLFG